MLLWQVLQQRREQQHRSLARMFGHLESRNIMMYVALTHVLILRELALTGLAFSSVTSSAANRTSSRSFTFLAFTKGFSWTALVRNERCRDDF